jgi:putative spermidine/putrescine transport system permease protein
VTGVARWRQGVLLAWPALVILGGFVVPFCLLLEVSLGQHDEGGFWSPGFEPGNFLRMLTRGVVGTLLYSVGLAIVVALVSTALAFPFTWLITRMGRRAQVAWLILLLSTLSLSEVLVAFAWQVMLSKRIGLGDLFVALGLSSASDSLSPSLGAVVACLVYLVLPYTVLLIYPALSRLDPHVVEAARMLGASPARVILTTVLPMLRGPLLSSTILASVSTIGTYVTPQVLGRPEHWTIAVLVGKAALTGGDLPLAAALSILLLSVTLGLTGLTLLIGRRRVAAP